MFLIKLSIVCGVGNDQNLVLNTFMTSYHIFNVKLLFQRYLYDNFHAIYVIKIVIFIQFYWQSNKDNNTSANRREITLFWHDLKIVFFVIICEKALWLVITIPKNFSQNNLSVRIFNLVLI